MTDALAGSAFAPTQVGLEFPFPPSFESVEEERLHRKQRLAAALRVFGRLGFAEGVAGHITARDPEHPDRFWVNPFGMSFRHVRVSDLILVDHEGTVVEGRWPVNAAAFAIHAAIHEARPDVVAAAHTHSIHGRAWSALGRPIGMISQDACMFWNDHAVHADDGGAVVTDRDGGRRLAATLAGHKAVIHRNHGIITVGQSVDEAAWWYLALERCCQAQLLAEAVGTPHEVAEADARYTYEQTGYPLAGWFQFQPHVAEIVRSEPDLLD